MMLVGRSAPARFIMAAVTALGMPLVLGVPESVGGKLQALAGLLVLAAACAGATVLFLHRPNRPFATRCVPAYPGCAAWAETDDPLSRSRWSSSKVKSRLASLVCE